MTATRLLVRAVNDVLRCCCLKLGRLLSVDLCLLTSLHCAAVFVDLVDVASVFLCPTQRLDLTTYRPTSPSSQLTTCLGITSLVCLSDISVGPCLLHNKCFSCKCLDWFFKLTRSNRHHLPVFSRLHLFSSSLCVMSNNPAMCLLTAMFPQCTITQCVHKKNRHVTLKYPFQAGCSFLRRCCAGSVWIILAKMCNIGVLLANKGCRRALISSNQL